MKRNAWVGAALLIAGLSAGCVTRKYTILSDPPGAMVYRNGQQLGPTPVDDYFVYYGKYHFTLIKEGYETLTVDQDIPAPWYEIPGVDFVSENLFPCKIRDARTFTYALQPLQTVRSDTVLNRAADLRARGRTIIPRPAQTASPTTPPSRPAALAATPATVPVAEAAAPAPQPVPFPGSR